MQADLNQSPLKNKIIDVDKLSGRNPRQKSTQPRNAQHQTLNELRPLMDCDS